jgi:hypothetical protein
MMMTLADRNRQELILRLAELCRGVRFQVGRPASISDEEVEISAVLVRGQGHPQELLLGVACSHRLRTALRDLLWVVRDAGTGGELSAGVGGQN